MSGLQSDPEQRVDALWLNANLATMTPCAPYGAIRDGALAVRDGKLAWVGRRSDLPADLLASGAPVHDAEGAWITPGLVDCHTHLIHGGNRAREFELRLQGATYQEIARQGGGIAATVEATRRADEDTLFRSAARRLACLLAEGVTTVEIKSGYGLDRDTELRMLRVARRLGRERPVTVSPTYLGAHALPPEFKGRPEAYLDLVCEEVMPQVARQGLADAVDAFCETIAFSLAQTERVLHSARRLGLAVKLHAEQLSCLGGAALAARHQAWSADHLEHLSLEGVQALAASGTVAVLLPGAFYFLGESQRPPVEALRRAGVPLALATDCNPGTSPLTSLLLVLNLGCVLFGLTPQEALAGVTVQGAAALGLAQSKGTLAPGKDADFVLWEIEGPEELAYRLGCNPCLQVVRAGEVVTDRRALPR